MTLRSIAAVTLALVMVIGLVSYFLTAFNLAPLGSLISVSLAALVVNLLGVIALANLGAVNPLARRLTGVFLGWYIVLSATYGAFVAGIQTESQLIAAGILSLVVAVLASRAIAPKIAADRWAAWGIMLVAIGFLTFGLTTQQAVLGFQIYQRGFGGGAIVAASLFVPTVRSWLAARFRLNGDTPIVIASFILGILTLGFIADAFGIFTVLRPLASGLSSNLVTPTLVLGQLAVFILLGFLGVGWLTRRSWRETLARLGIRKPTGSDVKAIIGFTILLFGVNYGLSWLGASFHLIDPASDDAVTRGLLASFNSGWWSLFLALSAGVGEEILFRGALQPRFGLIVTSLTFALLHVQYQWFGILIVLVLGLTLGWERKRFSTTASITSHLLYDFVGLIMLLSTKGH